MGPADRWLLIGNSRWHWAQGSPPNRDYWSQPPPPRLSQVPDRWAAVGAVPAGLDPATRVTLEQIPLGRCPTWLGIDRALAGWQAWRQSGTPVLVADAGTALSLTWVDGQGGFAGGRLLAGVGLQLRALHAGTLALPPVELPAPAAIDAWPQDTASAMAVGVVEGLAGALQRAASQLQQRQPQLQLWLTGGDAERLHALLTPSPQQPLLWTCCPGLCLDALAALDPAEAKLS